MKQLILFILYFSCSAGLFSQYSIEGEVLENTPGTTVYLSIIEDYRKLSRVYFEQIIRKTVTDSLGHFKFKGDNLPLKNRIYRVHIDECINNLEDPQHFLASCDNDKSVLFLASNSDSIVLPVTTNSEMFCEINSANPNANVFLEIETLKEEMALDFLEVGNEASKQLNLKKWFSRWKQYGLAQEDPLVELYIYAYLSDKRNETYTYYLNDLIESTYYEELSTRLETRYPLAPFTLLYDAEISTDQYLARYSSGTATSYHWLVYLLLVFSVLLNLLLFYTIQKSKQVKMRDASNKLTAQEQKIVDCILEDKTNKEIAATLFISVSTVKTHINNLYKKLHVEGRKDIKSIFQK